MALDAPVCIPFRSLPIEIRSNIYRELLCAFTSTEVLKNTTLVGAFTPTSFTPPSSTPRYLHEIDTAILRTSSTIYKEAYDTLAKTNRFAVPVPIMASDKRVVSAFKGYVVAMHIGCTKPVTRPGHDWKEMRDLMILHRDLGNFCEAFDEIDMHRPGLKATLTLSIMMAPVLFGQPSCWYAPSFMGFFTEVTQKTLLAPFRSHFRGYTSVKVIGHIDKALAATTCEEIQQYRWSDPRTILSDFAAAEAKGSELYQQRNEELASEFCLETTMDYVKMHSSSAWLEFVARGGEPFVSALAELHFLTCPNLAHAQITLRGNSAAASRLDVDPASAIVVSDYITQDALSLAENSMKKDHWMKGFVDQPEDKHKAKLCNRSTLLARLQGLPAMAGRALWYINAALRFSPGDATILMERDMIVARANQA